MPTTPVAAVTHPTVRSALGEDGGVGSAGSARGGVSSTLPVEAAVDVAGAWESGGAFSLVARPPLPAVLGASSSASSGTTTVVAAPLATTVTVTLHVCL